MSRIGKLPIAIPAGVTITVDNGSVKVTGPKGELSEKQLPEVSVSIDDGNVKVERNSDEKLAKSQHGLMRSLINNMVIGVTNGFTKELEVNGVGFKVALAGDSLDMALGFSHPVKFKIPTDIKAEVKQNKISLSGISKQRVGQTAAQIRALKKPEPYKGKGIKYTDEQIIRKSGKTGAK